jgi:penicillin-binding protein 1B
VLLDAVLTVEDRDFFGHEGVDVSRIVGAAVANVRAGRVREGASTITQQLAKNLFLSPRRTPLRKLRELCMAIALEERYTKEEILTAYLNVIYMGQDGGRPIHGVAAASTFYTGRDVSQLSLADAALLAGMIRGPNLYAPARHPDRARTRRDLVLRLMRERGVITDAAFDAARAAPLPEPRDAEAQPETRYFADFVTAHLRAAIGEATETQALEVFTSLDLALQDAATRAVAEELRRLERRYPALRRADRPVQAALVAISPRTGEVLAMVGGRDYGMSQFNRAVDAHRQPGSAFKPVVALTALTADRSSGTAQGPFTLASILEDTPLSVATRQGAWQPVNYDRRFRGSLTLREALERSLNVPFARLGLAVGAEQIVATARRLGIASPLRAVPSLALGSSEVTPLELARAYGVLGAEGVLAPVNPILAAVDADGNLLAQLDAHTTRAYTEEEAYLVTSALLGAVERGTGRGLRAAGYHGPFAAKSGTTNDFRDGWFVGYTPDIAVAVWVGFDDGQELGLPGSRLALPILGRFLALSFGEEGAGTFSRPRGLEVIEIDPASGLRAGWGCGGQRELFLPGTAPTQRCDRFGRDHGFHIADRRTDARSLLRGLLHYLDRAVQ